MLHRLSCYGALGAVLFLMFCFREKPPSSSQRVSVPVYPGAMSVQRNYSLQVSYDLTIAYPATELVNFYDRELKRLGFEPFVDDSIGQRTWKSFKDGTVPGEPLVHQFMAGWQNSSRNTRYLLSLRYQTAGADFGAVPDSHRLQVSLFAGPISGSP